MRPEGTLVLVHGLAIRHAAAEMFPGVEERLGRLAPVVRPIVQGDGTLAALTERLWQALAEVSGPLVLLCHSMGGLQARQLLTHPEQARRIRAVVTLGTPHDGTPLARVAAAFGRGYADCTAPARRQWSLASSAAEQEAIRVLGIRCGSVIAAPAAPLRTAWLRPTHALLGRLSGPSDGVVPTATQTFGTPLGTCDLDHAESVLLTADVVVRDTALAVWERMARFGLLGAFPDRRPEG